MNYILVNRNNIVVDIIPDKIRYIKLQSKGQVIACEKDNGTGVIGSDANTHYVLTGSDMTNSPDAIRVIARETIPSGLTPGLHKFDPETNEFMYRYSLEEAQVIKQEQNKALFAEYLTSHPLTWVDGKNYGITLEDQSEISLILNQYQSAVQAGAKELPILKWHAKHEESTTWAFEDLVELSLAITNTVYPVYNKCQEYKTAIYNAASMEELLAIEVDYNI